MQLYLDTYPLKIQKKWTLIKELILLRLDDSETIFREIYHNMYDTNYVESILALNLNNIDKRYLIIEEELNILKRYLELHDPDNVSLNIVDRLNGCSLLDICNYGYFKTMPYYFKSGDWVIDKKLSELLIGLGIHENIKKKRQIISRKNKRIKSSLNKKTKKRN